jgi:tetratricopeptide (TPR) repeat protein
MEDVTTNAPADESPDAINQQASVWMKRGIGLLEAGAPAGLREAIGCFDHAIELRRKLPLAANPFFRYGLVAGWMNRGDALTRLGSAENLSAALSSYDAALETLRDLPVDANPLFRRRLAIAWSNRGLSLQAQDTAAASLEAGRSFGSACSVLRTGNAAEIVDRDYLLAAAQMNHANALVPQPNQRITRAGPVHGEASDGGSGSSPAPRSGDDGSAPQSASYSLSSHRPIARLTHRD